MRILVVEDEPGLRYLLNDILKDDYRVYDAEDGQRALELIDKVIPDLVICDVLMPNVSGLQLCNKMKNDPVTCQVPLFFYLQEAAKITRWKDTKLARMPISPNLFILHT